MKPGANAVFYHRRYEPCAIALGQRIKNELKNEGIKVKSFNGSLLFEPWEVQTKSNTPYQVFTRFWETCKIFPEPETPLPPPKEIPSPSQRPRSLEIQELRLLPTIDWAQGIRKTWGPGEDGAWHQLKRFLQSAIHAYEK